MAAAHPDTVGSHVTKQEREEMCIALSATQESALIQVLLEVCLPTKEDKEVCVWVGNKWGCGVMEWAINRVWGYGVGNK